MRRCTPPLGILVEATTTAVQAGPDQLSVIDSGDALHIQGFADASQTHLCDTIRDRLLASEGVKRAQVLMQARDTTSSDWACTAGL